MDALVGCFLLSRLWFVVRATTEEAFINIFVEVIPPLVCYIVRSNLATLKYVATLTR
jgi:hypothetical protein